MRQLYVYREGLGVIPKDTAPQREGGFRLIRDQMDELRHPVTGQLVDSKSKFRQITKAAGCEEVGTSAFSKPEARRPDVRSDAIKALKMVREGYRPQIMSRAEFDR